jgi:hypothetical protein
VPHQDDVVDVTVLLVRRPATRRVAAIIAHADDGAFVERTENEQIFKTLRHESIVRDPQTRSKAGPDRIVVYLNPFLISATGLDARFRWHDGFDEFEPTVSLSFPRKRESSQRMVSNFPALQKFNLTHYPRSTSMSESHPKDPAAALAPKRRTIDK